MLIFKTKSKDLLKTLKHIKAVVPSKGKRALVTALEITLTDNKATFAVPGAIFHLECSIKGACKATVPFWHFYRIIKDIQTKEIEIVIDHGCLKINAFTFKCATTFFETDNILRTIQLNANYTEMDLLHLLKEEYTWDELEFNNLNSLIFKAQANLNVNMEKAYQILKPYGIHYDELEDIVISSLNNNQYSSQPKSQIIHSAKLEKVYKLLQPYGVIYKEIEDFVISRINE